MTPTPSRTSNRFIPKLPPVKSVSRLSLFFGIDARSLALFRIFLALILLGDLLIRAGDLEAFYTDFGVLPRGVLLDKFSNPWNFSVYLVSGTFFVQSLLFLAHGFFALMLLVGYRVRWASFLCWLFTFSLQVRNPMVIQGGDDYLRLLLFWGMFLPLGARFSLDNFLNPANRRPPGILLSPGTAALLAQVVFVYFFSALHKTGPEWRESGDAVYLALSISQFTKPFGAFLLQFPGFLKWLTFIILGIEQFGAFLFFSPAWTAPLRAGMAGVFLLMHIGFWQSMELGIFPWACMCGIIPFLPAWFWEKINERSRSGPASKLKFFMLKKIGGFVRRFRLDDALRRASKSVNTKTREKKSASFQPFFPKIPAFGRNFIWILLAYAFFWNLGQVKPDFDIPQNLKPVGLFSGLNQQWNMFSPKPLSDDGWYVIPGRLTDGSEVDLFRDGQPVHWEKPQWGSRLYPNDRWRKYMMNLWTAANNGHRLYFGKYLCRRWNREAPAGKKLSSFEIFFMLNPTMPPGQISPITKVSVWKHLCFEGPGAPEP